MIKDCKPSDDELEYLSLELGGKWDTLGRRLGFNQAAIDDFDIENKKLEEKAFRMLQVWKQREGSKATYTVLYNALCHELVKCRRQAEKFCCERL